MVPYLQDATKYDLGAVVLKEKLSRGEKIRHMIPGAIRVGFLEEFVKKEMIGGALERSKEWCRSEENFNQQYYFEEADQKKQDKKFIRVELLGCERYIQPHPPGEYSMTVDMKTRGRHR